jgi:hypothetical protein
MMPRIKHGSGDLENFPELGVCRDHTTLVAELLADRIAEAAEGDVELCIQIVPRRG